MTTKGLVQAGISLVGVVVVAVIAAAVIRRTPVTTHVVSKWIESDDGFTPDPYLSRILYGIDIPLT